MKHCCPDGDLRAYLDGEAAAEVRASMAAHLDACPACAARYRELSERAAWVSATMALSESAPPLAARRARPSRWPVGVVALAAVLAVAFFLLPRHAPAPPAPPVAQVAARPAPVPTAAPAAVDHVVHRPAPRPPAPAEEFLRLDDEPIETATIVRVSTDSGLQADLIVGPDGRAHAVRVVHQ
jgi:anti-sigma factor RsiW